jgi:hypothetical protein
MKKFNFKKILKKTFLIFFFIISILVIFTYLEFEKSESHVVLSIGFLEGAKYLLVVCKNFTVVNFGAWLEVFIREFLNYLAFIWEIFTYFFFKAILRFLVLHFSSSPENFIFQNLLNFLKNSISFRKKLDVNFRIDYKSYLAFDFLSFELWLKKILKKK